MRGTMRWMRVGALLVVAGTLGGCASSVPSHDVSLLWERLEHAQRAPEHSALTRWGLIEGVTLVTRTGIVSTSQAAAASILCYYEASPAFAGDHFHLPAAVRATTTHALVQERPLYKGAEIESTLHEKRLNACRRERFWHGPSWWSTRAMNRTTDGMVMSRVVASKSRWAGFSLQRGLEEYYRERLCQGRVRVLRAHYDLVRLAIDNSQPCVLSGKCAGGAAKLCLGYFESQEGAFVILVDPSKVTLREGSASEEVEGVSSWAEALRDFNRALDAKYGNPLRDRTFTLAEASATEGVTIRRWVEGGTMLLIPPPQPDPAAIARAAKSALWWMGEGTDR